MPRLKLMTVLLLVGYAESSLLNNEVEKGLLCGSSQTQCASFCCPFADGQCCWDGFKCCPNGYTCAFNVCIEKSLLSNTSAIQLPAQASHTQKKKSKSRSLTGSHSCPHMCGSGLCCPMAHGVCCAGGSHCCPKGYTCETGDCVRGFKVKQPVETMPHKYTGSFKKFTRSNQYH